MLFALLASTSVASVQPDIQSVLSTSFKDASFTAKVQSSNQRELAKINNDFASSYRFKSSNVWLKEPMMLRMEATVDDTKIYFIVSGTTRLVRVPRANINQRENLAKAPGKRQTPLDFGLLTPSMFKNFLTAKFVRTESRGDYSGCHVFDLTYVPSLDDTSRYRVWMDPNKKFVRKREWYSQNGGNLVATLIYDTAVQGKGVWFPTRVTAKNADDKVGGSTSYSALKLNEGIPDSLFKVN